MVAREPGESDADYELRQRDHRHSKSRCVVSSSSEEEEEEEEEKESRAAGSAAGSELGAAGSATPVEIVEERKEKEEEKEKQAVPEPKDPEKAQSPEQSPRSDSINLSNDIQVDISRLKLRGQQRWHKKASRDFDWLSKSSRSSTLERSGPDPSERLELSDGCAVELSAWKRVKEDSLQRLQTAIRPVPPISQPPRATEACEGTRS